MIEFAYNVPPPRRPGMFAGWASRAGLMSIASYLAAVATSVAAWVVMAWAAGLI